MAPYLDAARSAGRSRVVAVGCAQEYAQVWTATRRDTDPDKCPQFSFTKQQRRVSVFYVYIWDTRVGQGSSRSARTSRIRSRCGAYDEEIGRAHV